MGTTLRIGIISVIIAAAAAAFVLRRGPPSLAPLPQSTPRIVSLAPNVTEILFALGLGEHIVGATDTCNYPPPALSIPRVSGFGTPNLETLLAVKPDMVIACGLEKPQLFSVLEQSGIRAIDVQRGGDITGFPQLFDAIREIGEATGRSAEARTLVANMQTELDTVAARVAKIDAAERPRVFIEIEDNPLMTAGAGSFLNDLVTRAGGRNVAHDIHAAYPRIDSEQVIAWNPEVILVAHSNTPGEAAKRLTERIGWANVAAVRQRRIIDDINPDLLFRPGPRLADGVRELAERLHPTKRGGGAWERGVP